MIKDTIPPNKSQSSTFPFSSPGRCSVCQKIEFLQVFNPDICSRCLSQKHTKKREGISDKEDERALRARTFGGDSLLYLNSNNADKVDPAIEKKCSNSAPSLGLLKKWHYVQKEILAENTFPETLEKDCPSLKKLQAQGFFSSPLHSIENLGSYVSKIQSSVWEPEIECTKKDHEEWRQSCLSLADVQLSWLPENKHGDIAHFLSNELLTPYQRKTIFILKENIEKFIAEIGLDNCGFLTLTFPDNVTDHKEAYRRFDNIRRRVFPKLFGPVSVRVSERQKRGSWHFHVLVDCRQDIRTGVNFDEIYGINGHRRKYSSASPYLRNIWSELRYFAERYGFGRTELLPIKSNIDAMAKYVGKYLSKGNMLRDERDKGVRLVGYRGEFVRSSPKMAWHSDGAQEWRRKLGKFSEIMGVKTLEGLQSKFGPRWAFHLKVVIASVDEISPYALPELVRSFMSHSSPWKCPSHLEKRVLTVMDGGVLYEKGVNFAETGQVYEIF